MPSSLKNRRSTAIRLSFPTVPSFKATPRRVDLYQRPYKHDILTLEFAKPNSSWLRVLRTGTPLQFTWTHNRKSYTWRGYVTNVMQSTRGQRENVMMVTAAGASYVLKAKSQEVFRNKTIPEVAEIIAKKYKLHFSGLPNSRRFPYLAISGQSYWQWLVEHAKKIGYAVYVDGVTMVFKPIDDIVDKHYTVAPTFSMISKVLPMNNQYYDRTLDSLEVLSGDFVEGAEFLKEHKTSQGVNPTTGAPFKSTSNTKLTGKKLRQQQQAVLFEDFTVTQVVNDVIAAQSLATGASMLAKFNLPAKLVGQGDAGARPFLPIQVTGTGQLTDGMWVVMEAHHILMANGDYQMEMKAATDGFGDDVQDSFRNKSAQELGTINVEKILAQADATGTSSAGVSSGLVSKIPVTNEGLQGFANSPTTWVARYNNQKGCCN